MSANYVDDTNVHDVIREVTHLATYNDQALPLLRHLQQCVASTPGTAVHHSTASTNVQSAAVDSAGSACSRVGDDGPVSSVTSPAVVPWLAFKRGVITEAETDRCIGGLASDSMPALHGSDAQAEAATGPRASYYQVISSGHRAGDGGSSKRLKRTEAALS